MLGWRMYEPGHSGTEYARDVLRPSFESNLADLGEQL